MPHDLRAFLKAFYATSDNSTDHEHAEYLSFFTPDSTLIMGLKTFKGHEEIYSMRDGMWAAVSTRHHAVSKVYPSATGEEVMLYGTVDYGLKNGKALSSDWAGRMVFDESGEKMKFYQVWIDVSPLVVAQGKRIEADEEGGIKIV